MPSLKSSFIVVIFGFAESEDNADTPVLSDAPRDCRAVVDDNLMGTRVHNMGLEVPGNLAKSVELYAPILWPRHGYNLPQVKPAEKLEVEPDPLHLLPMLEPAVPHVED